MTLYRRNRARYVQDGHTQRVQIDGQRRRLSGRVLHDDRKPLTRWLSSQARYAELEVERLVQSRWSDLDWPDRLRLVPGAMAIVAPLYCLVRHGGILDGRAGFAYALQRGAAEAILSLALLEPREERKGTP